MMRVQQQHDGEAHPAGLGSSSNSSRGRQQQWLRPSYDADQWKEIQEGGGGGKKKKKWDLSKSSSSPSSLSPPRRCATNDYMNSSSINRSTNNVNNATREGGNATMPTTMKPPSSVPPNTAISVAQKREQLLRQKKKNQQLLREDESEEEEILRGDKEGRGGRLVNTKAIEDAIETISFAALDSITTKTENLLNDVHDLISTFNINASNNSSSKRNNSSSRRRQQQALVPTLNDLLEEKGNDAYVYEEEDNNGVTVKEGLSSNFFQPQPLIELLHKYLAEMEYDSSYSDTTYKALILSLHTQSEAAIRERDTRIAAMELRELQHHHHQEEEEKKKQYQQQLHSEENPLNAVLSQHDIESISARCDSLVELYRDKAEAAEISMEAERREGKEAKVAMEAYKRQTEETLALVEKYRKQAEESRSIVEKYKYVSPTAHYFNTTSNPHYLKIPLYSLFFLTNCLLGVKQTSIVKQPQQSDKLRNW